MKTKTSIFLRIKNLLTNEAGNFMGADGGAGDGGDGDGGDGDGGAGDGGDGGTNWQYPEGFDESLKGNPTLLKYADKEAGTFNQAHIMKALVHATGMIGKDKVALPDESWSDDQWNDLYKKLGKPEDIQEYGLKNELPEGMQENKEFYDKFKEMAFQSNLLPGQAQKMYDSVNEFIAGSIKEANEYESAEHNKMVDSLKKEWGDGFENKCNRAFSALEQFAEPEEIEAMKSYGMLDNPVITKLFDKIASGMGGDNFNDKAKGSFGMTPDEAAEEINKYYQSSHPFMNSRHPEHQHYKNKMLKLQRAKLAGRK
jgi:hypothetical protein